MKLFGVLFLLLICYSCQTNESAEPSTPSIPNEFAISIDSLVANADFNGVVMVTKDTNLLYAKAVGYADLETKQPLDLQSQFVIGSISKQITAVLVLREYENGRLQLDDYIGQYLNEIEQPWANEISIHHLLTHTHGIVALEEPLAFEAGTQFQYSQLGYDLLAQIIEAVSGQSFEDKAAELFRTYELKETFHPNTTTIPNLVKGYEEENGELTHATNSLQNYPAAGSFISTAGDLVRWNQLLHSNQLLKKETLNLMKQRYATRQHPIFDTVEYGYGLLFKEGEQMIEIGALGYAPGFVSAAYYYPETKMSLVVLQNTAKNLNDFRQTFGLHLVLMQAMKQRSLPDTIPSQQIIPEKKDTTIKRWKVLVVPCANGYDYWTKGFDLEPLLEKYLKTSEQIEILEFPYQKMGGSGYQGVYDKKYCDAIIQQTNADFLVLNRMEGTLWPLEKRTNSWGYATKIVATKDKKQAKAIAAKKLAKFEDIETHIEANLAKMIATFEALD